MSTLHSHHCHPPPPPSRSASVRVVRRCVAPSCRAPLSPWMKVLARRRHMKRTVMSPSDTVLQQKELPPKKNELKELQTKFSEATPPQNVLKRWRLLYKHAETIMKETGVSIKISCDNEVFGVDKRICLVHKEVLALLKFQMVGQVAISAYKWMSKSRKCYQMEELDEVRNEALSIIEQHI
ncbi:hypothetical protein OROMI_009923 [Orobanche minor]